MSADLHVRHVTGRYPRCGVMRSDNLEVQVTEVARVYRIRIDDVRHPDAWFELTVEVETGGAATAEGVPA